MKGVILAGGTGSRLYPLTKVTNKHLLPIYDKPMIFYPLTTLKNAGITDILIVSGEQHAGHFLNLLGSGADLGVQLSYEVQKGSGGIADALRLAEKFADGDKIAVILGDNIFEQNILDFVSNFESQNFGAMIFLKAVTDPQRFGVADVLDNQVVSIEEKPQNPKTDLAVTGLYLYDNTVFSIIKNLQPSARGEYEITDVNNAYIARGALTFSKLSGYWTDAGTFESLFEANNLVRKFIFESKDKYPD